MENGVRRLLVDVSKWNPSEKEFSAFISLLPLHEQSSIIGFMRFEDRKRTFVSRLLQYLVVHELLGIPFNEIVIKRTIEGKPYLENAKLRTKFPNFNFNSSHDGDYVAIASEPLCLIGLDVVSSCVPENETVTDFIKNFSSCLTSLEWNNIMKAGTSDGILTEFYRYWCLKEAYVKATGTGLGFRLDRLEFRHVDWTNISICVDGKELADWQFWILKPGKGHWAGLAKGPPKSATPNYRSVLGRTKFEDDEYFSSLHSPNPSFTLCTVEQLILFAKFANDGYGLPEGL